MKLILIQPQGKIVSHWAFAHKDCDCYGFIDHKSKELQWEISNAACSGVGWHSAASFAATLKETWPDHAIAQVL